MNRIRIKLRCFLTEIHQEDRADVPGWVMITLMSAILVAGLLVLAQGAFADLFNAAVEMVMPS